MDPPRAVVLDSPTVAIARRTEMKKTMENGDIEWHLWAIFVVSIHVFKQFVPDNEQETTEMRVMESLLRDHQGLDTFTPTFAKRIQYQED